MNGADSYFFDLNGWIRVPAVFSPHEIAAMNAAVDTHVTPASTILRPSPNSSPELLRGEGGSRVDHFGMLAWPHPAGELFRSVLAHPRLVPYLTSLCGQGYRMDHDAPMITMQEGTPGGGLHGGGGLFDPLQYYVFSAADQTMHNGLVVAALQLTDGAEGEGGLAVVPGSESPCNP